MSISHVNDPKREARGAKKILTKRIPVVTESLLPTKKPRWIRIKAPTNARVTQIKNVLREHKLHTVCEEASCPNLSECFSHGTATFMIMGDICTRRCSFCDVAHGRPNPLDEEAPENLAKVIQDMKLSYVVITSVDRDDLKDGGASHFADCIRAVRLKNPNIKIEILVPDFRKRQSLALDNLSIALPDVFNHNLETAPQLYRAVRPGSDYQLSLNLIKQFKARFPTIPTKSGLMLGLGETDDDIIATMKDLRAHDCDMITLGQYLQPSKHHHPVIRYVTPETFEYLGRVATDLGFTNAASGPMVRSSYHADKQAAGAHIN